MRCVLVRCLNLSSHMLWRCMNINKSQPSLCSLLEQVMFSYDVGNDILQLIYHPPLKALFFNKFRISQEVLPPSIICNDELFPNSSTYMFRAIPYATNICPKISQQKIYRTTMEIVIESISIFPIYIVPKSNWCLMVCKMSFSHLTCNFTWHYTLKMTQPRDEAHSLPSIVLS